MFVKIKTSVCPYSVAEAVFKNFSKGSMFSLSYLSLHMNAQFPPIKIIRTMLEQYC